MPYLPYLAGSLSLASGLATLIFIPLMGIFIGSGLFILGLAYFLMAYGLWNAKNWAWTLTLVLSGIGIIVGIGSIIVGNLGSIFHIIINAIVIYYLYRPNVKAFLISNNCYTILYFKGDCLPVVSKNTEISS